MNLEKLESIKKKFIELTALISSPEVIADNKEWTKLVKEHSQIQPVVDAYDRYLSLVNEEQDLIEMMSDDELKEMAQEELPLVKFYFGPSLPTTTKMLSWKVARVLVATKRLWLQRNLCVCIKCTPRKTVGK